MRLTEYLTHLLSSLVVFPAALLCVAPMKNQMNRSGRVIFLRVLLVLGLLMPLAAFVEVCFSLSYNGILPLVVGVTFIAYCASLRAPFCKSVAVYMLVFAFVGFFSNFANLFDAALHPASSPDDFSLAASAFQALLITAAVALVYHPVRKYGSAVVDQLDIPRVWYMTLPVSGVFIAYNLLHVPKTYASLYVDKGIPVFLISLLLLLTLLCLTCVVFYFIVMGLLERARTRERNAILEMQESAYQAQQRYLDDTRKLMHDFRHTLATLDELSQTGNVAEIRTYLRQYIDARPVNVITRFCDNQAVNSLLNYYNQRIRDAAVTFDWEVALPDDMPVSNIDLCAILGNILENALRACMNVPPEKRFIDVVVRTESDAKLFIVASNAFDGNVKLKEGQYVSTRRDEQGIGLKSIASIAEKYQGTASFKHDGDEFYTDVVLPLNRVTLL